MKNIFRPSLKKKLAFLLTVGYFVPVLMIIAMLSSFITQQYDHQVLDKVQLSLSETTELVLYYLTSMTEDSRRLIVEGDLERAHTRYLDEMDDLSQEKALLFLQDYPDSALATTAQSSLERTFSNNSLFHSAALYYTALDLPSHFVTNTSRDMEKATFGTYEALYPHFLEITQDLGTSIAFSVYNNRLYLLRYLSNVQLEKYALLILEVNTDRMIGAFQGITGVCQVELLFDEEKVESPLFMEATKTISLSQEQRAEGHNVTVTLLVDIDQGQDVLESFQNEITQVLLLIIPALGYMLFSFYRHVTRPIKKLMEAQFHIEMGELGYLVEKLPDSIELRALTTGFNTMSRSMKDQFIRSHQEQQALHEARVKTLQSQINPHFLNNTLEIINWETRIAGNENASAMIDALSTMLRATMNREGKAQIALSQELTYVDAYLFIQSCRMGARLTVEKKVEEESLELLVPRLIFQPVVENACEHGIQGQKEGRIVISSFLSKENLILEVKNSGHMSPETLENLSQLLAWDEKNHSYRIEAENLGLRNVNQRVKMMYGEVYGLDIFNDNQGMTVMRLALPRESVHNTEPLLP
ncbi:MAG: histidine kinase [Eubacteriales bacterium]